MKVDFRDINVNEELSAAESTDMVVASDLLGRLERRREEMDAGIPLPWAKLDTLFRFRPSEITLMGGYSGHFKSLLTSQIGLHAVSNGWRVGVASLELMAEDIVEQYAEMGAGAERPTLPWVERFAGWCGNKLFIYDRVDAIRPDVAIQMVIAFAKYQQCSVVILDALMMMGVCDDLERERDFVQTLVAVAKQFKIHVILVHHVRKPSGPQGEGAIPNKYDFIGSSHLANTATNILICWHDKKKSAKSQLVDQGIKVDDFDDTKPDLVLKVAKQRYGKFEGSVGLWQSKTCRAFCNSRQRNYRHIEVGGA